jgi:hypothetical protein
VQYLRPSVERPIYHTMERELGISSKRMDNIKDIDGAAVCFAVAGDLPDDSAIVEQIDLPNAGEWSFSFSPKAGSLLIIASQARLLFSTWCYLDEELGDFELSDYSGSGRPEGVLLQTAFDWNRPVYDSLLTQLQRTARGFDWKGHIREQARIGHSHIEVNALSTPHGLEPGVPNEVYPVFYTYCAALDQFSSSKLNKGCYPKEYLAANMALLKRYADEALRYGMQPGMLCFEPRNAPDLLLDRYPMLRGARVDHPFRSLKPRYSLTLSHPYVRSHYKELVQNILQKVPELGYISITSNDSGAGFEFTRSLYVGSNGGPYLIREWKSVEEIAKTAAKNAMSFFKLIRDVGREINPDFRVIMRLEPFGSEREYVLEELGDGIDVEGASFQHAGYGFTYHHDRYEDVVSVQSTIWHNRFRKTEEEFRRYMQARDGYAHALYSFDGFQNFDPLLGIPVPWMLHEKLAEMKAAGFRHIGHVAGLTPPSLSPWDINREVIRAYQLDSERPADDVMSSAARRWVGSDFAARLVDVWKIVQESIRAFPPPGLYSTWGMAWYKLWVRPLVPDIEAISEEDRAYYEEFLLATPHNPNRVDLNMDILFELGGPELAAKIVERTDTNTLPVAARAVEKLKLILEDDAISADARKVFADLAFRIRGLEIWFTTQRNAQAWIAGVHGWLRTEDTNERGRCRKLLDEMIDSEISNSEKLIELWNESSGSFMAVSDIGESVHIHGDNLAEHLTKRLALMKAHRNDVPRIDPDFIWRVPGLDFYSIDEMGPGVSPVTDQLDNS